MKLYLKYDIIFLKNYCMVSNFNNLMHVLLACLFVCFVLNNKYFLNTVLKGLYKATLKVIGV
jgi:hypothetical protein